MEMMDGTGGDAPDAATPHAYAVADGGDGRRAGACEDLVVSTVIAEAYDTPEKRAAAAAMSDLDRQVRIEEMLVCHPSFDLCVAKMRRFHRPLAKGRHLRGQVCGIIGHSRTGKSTAIRHYAAQHGDVDNKDFKGVKKIVYVDCKENWIASDLCDGLYAAMGLGRTPGRMKIETAFDNVRLDIAASGVEMLVLDDAQWVFATNETKLLRSAFGLVTGLAEMKTCNVLLSGTKPIEAVVEHHAHVKGRGQFPGVEVEPYDFRSREALLDFQCVLQAIDDRLPFAKLSGLARENWVPQFYRLSLGSIGPLMDYVRAAAIAAIADGADKISKDHIVDVVAERWRGGGTLPFDSPVDLEALAAAENERLKASELHLKKTRRGRGIGR